MAKVMLEGTTMVAGGMLAAKAGSAGLAYFLTGGGILFGAAGLTAVIVTGGTFAAILGAAGASEINADEATLLGDQTIDSFNSFEI